MNLCNIHAHSNAEHKGPGFSVFVGDDASGGYACNKTADLTEAELIDPYSGQGAFGGVAPAIRLRFTGFTHPAMSHPVQG